MSSAHSTSVQAPWHELAERWQALGQEWAQWWARATATAAPVSASTSAAAHYGAGASAATASNPWAPFDTMANRSHVDAAAAIDPQALAALNAKYQPRFQMLWAAAQNALIAAPIAGASVQIPTVAMPAPGDRRFAAREWNELPYFALLKQYYLLAAEYLKELAELAPLSREDKRRLQFVTRQTLDALAPSNFAATNPEVIQRALETEGESLARGYANFVADAQKGRISMTDERAFGVGKNLAMTPGHVVFRNELIELIQYSPSTDEVHERPLLIVPPCINKYYILDLQPENSFVRWAVAQKQTVFLISWRNIPAELGALEWDDYVVDGVFRAIDVVKAISGSDIVNTLGFCVGGTLLAEALAVLAGREDESVASLTLLTALLDFEEPGDIGVYISPESVAAREPALMAGQRVHGGEIAHAFASLRPNDLVWNYVVNNYLKGETPPAFDLLYWNSDSANLPGPMYAYYLRNMYLGNRLRECNALAMRGEPVDLSRITVPSYILAAREDHIVPWKSAYRNVELLGGDSTFVLGASGHIAGVVNPPEKKRRNFWLNDRPVEDADEWLASAESRPGSWWPHWAAWLARYGGALQPAPSGAGSEAYPPLDPAPGRYVREWAD